MHIWFRKKAQVRLCELYVEYEFASQGHTDRSLAAKLAGFRGQRAEKLELVRTRVSDESFQQLSHDLGVVRRLMDRRLPRNDNIWVHNLGRHTDRELPAQTRCVQRMQLLLHACLPPLLHFPRAGEYAQELASMAADGFYRDFLRQTWPFLDHAGRRKVRPVVWQDVWAPCEPSGAP